ncbi:MAG TPA: phosphoribosylglycinamide formyltransferase [Chitinophagaceae bacterium]|nr:phosphoribosylglycinamide formyltransferase [Chitinophagaceae bacterium]
MLKRLQQKWKVNGRRLALILFTFAAGGSFTGYMGRKLISFFKIEQALPWTIVYILLVVLLWPVMVLIVSIPLGQFRFFIQYILKIGIRMGIGKSKKQNQSSNNTIQIAVFASGAGSNTQKIIDQFRNQGTIKVALIASNIPTAGVLKIAEKEKIPALIIEKEKFFRGNGYADELKEKKISLIVLAGFLWKLPPSLLNAYPEKIINIHPALLPKYGGKGMFGHYVHEAVLANKEKESGISIHYVDELYDHGKILLQVKCPVMPDDTPDTLAQRVHALEHQHYPALIEQLAKNKLSQ